MRLKENFWLILPVIVIIPFIITTILIHESTQNEITEMVMEKETIQSEFKTKEIAKNTESVYELIDSKLDFITAAAIIDGQISPEEKDKLNTIFKELNEITSIDITVTNEEFVVLESIGDNTFSIGSSLKETPGITDVSNSKKPKINHVFEESVAKVMFQYPFYADSTFKGIILVTFSLQDIIKTHGNIEIEEEQFLFVIDKNYDIIVDPALVGKNLFEDSVVGYIGLEEEEAEHYRQVLENKKFYTSIYTNNLGERIDTGTPILVNDRIEYFLFIITPTHSIHESIENFVSMDQIQTVVLMSVFGFFVIGFALRQRKKTKQDKMAIIGHLSSNIAHDIRNPLAAIKTAGIIIGKENKNENDVITRELARIDTSSKRISHQIEEVLNYVRTTPLQLKINSTSKTIQDAIESTQIPENIKIQTSGEDVKCQYDHEKLLIVFINVLLNAVQAIGEKQGIISINVEEHKEKVVFYFKNNGPPIPGNVLPKIFEPLFTTNLKGTGLGLSSCKNIISQHRGKISVKPDPVTYVIEIQKR